MHAEAESLNQIIKKESQLVYDLLSEKGRNIFFPEKGILSQTSEAKGKKINATIGSAIEDDGGPMCFKSISDIVNQPASSVVSYAPGFGNPDIRKKWKDMLVQKNPTLSGKSFSNPMVTAALTHGLSMIGYLFLEKGEHFCLPDLYWENYDLVFTNSYGAVFNTFPLFSGSNFNIQSFREKLLGGSPRTIKLILNFPNNPTGYTPTIKEAEEIISIIKTSAEAGNKLLVILDDAYFNLVYEDGIEKQSLFAYLCDIHENVLAIKVDGPTKEDYVWGLRVGFITYGIKNGSDALYGALERKTGGAIRGNISNAPNISQSILLKAYTSPEYNNEKQAKYNTLKERYNTVKATLNDKTEYHEYFQALPFNSGYFMCVKLKEGLDGETVRSILLNEFSTGIINLDNLFRVAFSAVPKANIPELFENIYQACKKASGSK